MQIIIDHISGRPKGSRRAGASKARNGGESITIAAARKALALDKECTCAAVQLDDQPEQSSAVLDALGISLMNRGGEQQGARLIERALRIRRNFFGDDHPTTALSLNSYARVLRDRGQLVDAEKTAEVALRINTNVYGEQGYPLVPSLLELGIAYLYQGRHAEAEAVANRGLDILRKLELEDTDPNTSRLLDLLGRAQGYQNRLDAAAASFDEALKLDRAQVGKDHPKYASHLANYAEVKEAQGQFKQAESFLLKTMDVYANKLKRRCHPNLIGSYAMLGSMYLSRNSRPQDLRQAGKLLQEAARLELKLRGPDHVLLANDYANLGRWRYYMQDRRGALQYFQQALHIYQRNLRRGSIPEDYIYIAEVLTWMGRLLVEGGTAAQAAKAEPLLQRARSMWAKREQSGVVGEAAAAAAEGRALWLQGKEIERARELLLRGYSVLVEHLGEDYLFVVIVRGWIDEIGQQKARAA